MVCPQSQAMHCEFGQCAGEVLLCKYKQKDGEVYNFHLILSFPPPNFIVIIYIWNHLASKSGATIAPCSIQAELRFELPV